MRRRGRRERIARQDKRRKGAVTAAQLRAEEVVAIGAFDAVAFVLTGVGLHLFHVECIMARGTATAKAAA